MYWRKGLTWLGETRASIHSYGSSGTTHLNSVLRDTQIGDTVLTLSEICECLTYPIRPNLYPSLFM